jgi:hypothetical protein
MTEKDPGRIDLRVIDDADAERADRVIAESLARIAATPQQEPYDPILIWTERYTRPALAAAAVLAAIAIGTLALTEGRGDAPPLEVSALASWAESQHVPTNGELLLAFQGYEDRR